MSIKYPKVTFVVTSYNYEEYVLETLESIKNQNYDNFELIIIDNNSKDNSIKVIEEFINNNPDFDVKLIKNKRNKGQLGAIQTGLEYAEGEFISFIDSDDIIFEDYAKKLVDLHLQIDVALVCSQISEINEKSELITNSPKSNKIKSEYKLLNSNNAPFGGWFWSPLPAGMLRKSSIEPVLYYNSPRDWKTCPDKFLFNFANLIGGSAILNESLVGKRRHSKNAGISDKNSGNKRFNNDRVTKLNIRNNKRIRPCTLKFIIENKRFFYKRFGKFNTQCLIFKIYISYWYVIIQLLNYVKKFILP